MPLVDIKEAILTNISEYSKANRLDKEPYFVWWALNTFEKRDQIILAVHTHVWLPSTKYNVRVPWSTRQALEFDHINSNTVCQYAINKEMCDVAVAFKLKDVKKIIGNY